MKSLAGNGLLDIGQGCTLKSEHFSIVGHNHYLSQVKVQTDFISVPETSILNEISNITDIGSFKPESHKEEWQQIKTQIEDVKQQEQAPLSIHDVHQYSLLYSMLGVALITTCAYGLVRLQKKLNAARAATVNSPTQMTAAQEEERMGNSRAKPTSPSATRSRSIRLDIPNDNSA